MEDMMKFLNNIFARGLELRYTKFFTIYIFKLVNIIKRSV